MDPGPGLCSSRSICNRRTVAAESRSSRSRWLQNMNVWRLSTSPSLLTRPFFGCLDPSSSHSQPKRRIGFSRSGSLKRGQVSLFTNKKCLCPNFLKKRLTRMSFTGLGLRTERAPQQKNHEKRRQKKARKQAAGRKREYHTKEDAFVIMMMMMMMMMMVMVMMRRGRSTIHPQLDAHFRPKGKGRKLA